MIAKKQIQYQLPVFYPCPRKAFSGYKPQHSISIHQIHLKEKSETNKARRKRFSCQTMEKDVTSQCEDVHEKQNFTNKLLKHILIQIKQSHFTKNRGNNNDNNGYSKFHPSGNANSNLLNCQESMKIKSVARSSKRKSEFIQQAHNIPFKNKKIAQFKGKRAQTFQTQALESECKSVFHQNNLQPWQQTDEQLFELAGYLKGNTQQEGPEEIYLKSNHIKDEQPKRIQKFKPFQFQATSNKRSISYKRNSTASVKQVNTSILRQDKGQSSDYSNLRKTHYRQNSRLNSKHQRKRVLTQTKMECISTNIENDNTVFSQKSQIFSNIASKQKKRQQIIKNIKQSSCYNLQMKGKRL